MNVSSKPIQVTKPTLPPLSELLPYLHEIWGNKILTNGGPFHEQFEAALADFLGVPFVSLFSNGTIALISALKILKVKGDVITTPYSFVATAHALKLIDIKPVFVDIDPITLNIDARQIENAISNNTTAIMPVHVYGHPCDVDAIETIAKRHHLSVIYDAAHAFGVNCSKGSVLAHGDLSVVSFHATKVFNTFEGGAIISANIQTKKRIDRFKNFGFESETSIDGVGINGKMSELNAAIGLLQLKYIKEHIERRRVVDKTYRNKLQHIHGIRCHTPKMPAQYNYSYFPIFVENDYPITRDGLLEKLRNNNINARRYFYPLATDFSEYKEVGANNQADFPNSRNATEKVICLPIYPDLTSAEIERVVQCIRY